MADNKVIWVINQTAGKPDSGWGERHFNMSRYWVQKGYEVHIISGSYNHLFINQPTLNQGIFTPEDVAPGIRFCWVRIPRYKGSSALQKLWSMVVFAWRVRKLNAAILGKPEHIIVSSMPLFPILTGIYLKKKYKTKKLFFEIRDLWPLTPMHLSGYRPYNPVIILMKWIEKKGYRKSDHIISLLPNANRYINPISQDPQKYNWISNGIDENSLDSKSIPEGLKSQIPKDCFIIGYAGTMGMANALEYLVEAAVFLKNNASVHFVLVGDGYLKEELIQRAQNAPNITFIPKIQKNQVQDMLTYFDVCFIGRSNTSLFDYGVASNKYFDYMLAKKPILESSNKIKSPAELSGCGITVLPENYLAIVEGIREFRKMSTSQLKSIGEAGYDYVKKYHNFEYLSDKYLKLF